MILTAPQRYGRQKYKYITVMMKDEMSSLSLFEDAGRSSSGVGRRKTIEKFGVGNDFDAII